MSNKNKLLLFLLIIVLFFGIVTVFLIKPIPSNNKEEISEVFKNNSSIENNTDKTNDSKEKPSMLKITGIVRVAGLSSDENTNLGLFSYPYQITDLNKPIKYANDTFDGFYVNDTLHIKNLIGKCIEASITTLANEDAFTTKERTVHGSYTYNRLVGDIDSVKQIDFSECTHYNTVKEKPANPESTYKGTIVRFIRPASDIDYDYQIKLENPIMDNSNASGLTQTVSAYIITPGNTSTWEKIENNIDKEVTLKGFINWGYAESTFINVTSIELK
jgi:hypothetical protein